MSDVNLIKKKRVVKKRVPIDKRIPTEEQEQALFVRWLSKEFKGYSFFAIPNGEFRFKRTAMRLKAQGVSPGVPDLFIPHSSQDFHGLFIEMKRTKGGVLSDHQKKWIAYLKEKGYRVEVCKGFEEAKRVALDYLREGHLEKSE